MFTEEDIDLLNNVAQATDMATDSIQQVIDKATEPAFKAALQAQLKLHSDTRVKIEKMLHFDNIKVKQANPISKIQAQVVSSIKTLTTDNVTSKIAEMVIQGSTMGITEVTKELHNYKGNNLEIKVLVQQYLDSLQQNINVMKAYL
jgi:hypothetical protein